MKSIFLVMNAMPEIITAAQMLTLVRCGVYGSEKDRATPNEIILTAYAWDTKLLEWHKVPRSGGKMAPIVEAVNG